MQRVTVNPRISKLLARYSENQQALTFNDTTLEDKPSDVHPNAVNLDSYITPKIKLRLIMSAAMDTVTEKELALELAKLGGLGVLHRNMDPDEQADMVRWVRNKIHDGGMIYMPVTYYEDQTLSELQQDRSKNSWTFTNIPILDRENRLVGMVSRNELAFVEDTNPTMGTLMIPLDKTVYVQNRVGIEEAYQLMLSSKVKKLPVVDDGGKFIGMYTWKDVMQDENKMKTFALDNEGHFLVGAAVGVGDGEKERVDKLADAGCRLIIIDTSHGACTPAVEILTYIKQRYGDQIEVVVGNIASYDSAKYLLSQKYKPDALKVGIGSGSICTTRRVTGHGMPQITAVYQVYRAVRDCGLTTPIIVDGGIRYSSDIVKAIAVGASGVMMGNVFAGTDESPGRLVVDNGQKFKVVRGMGSQSAMNSRAGSRDRYFANGKSKSDVLTLNQMTKTVPEGVEGFTKYRGSVERVMTELLGGVRAGFAHSGARNVEEFRQNATMWIQTVAGTSECEPHSLGKILG